ncbi:MAG: Bax inhibitor-1/YccA family protein, partial [Bacteroidota bacterium]
ILFVSALIGAYFTATLGTPMLIYGGFIGGAIVSFIAARNLEKASLWSKVFAALEGLAVGGVSFFYGYMFEGIVFQAISLTMAILFTMLMLYKTGVIKVTERFRNIIMTAMSAIMLVYLVEFVLHLFGVDVPFLHDQSMIGVGISLVIVGVASFKLLVDFDNFERGEQFGAPKYMEWYFGMGLLFTLVWLYLEILYLLSNFLGSD